MAKICAMCGKRLSIEEFSVINGRRYNEYCADCQIQYYYDKRTVKASERQTTRDRDDILMYLCKTCGLYKYDIDFHKDRHNDVIRSMCAECYNQKHKRRGVKRASRNRGRMDQGVQGR